MDDMVERIMKISSGGFPIGKTIIADDGSGEPSVIAFLPDVEGDVVMMRFNCEDELEIITEDYSYISMSRYVLSVLADLLTDADALWAELDEYWDEKKETWVGWEHLATYPEIETSNSPAS